jgi:hypothetical protein
MISRRASATPLAAVLGAALLAGCYAHDDGSDDGSTDPRQGEAIRVGDAASDTPTDSVLDPAPDFTLTDLNPDSPTYGQDRSVSDMRGKVLLIFFANYA